MTHTVDSLIAFEKRVEQAFLDKRIRAPVHLCSPQQAQPLIDIFKDIRPQDWVFSTWRSHFHALLKGITEEELFQMILDGRSMFIMSKAHNFMSSAIVGGMLPIALGVAAGIHQKMLDQHYDPNYNQTVWVFCGDMCVRTGLFHEFIQYAHGHDLPVRMICEDNGLSTDTPTEEAWGKPNHAVLDGYRYERTYPHVGTFFHVQF